MDASTAAGQVCLIEHTQNIKNNKNIKKKHLNL